jgi:hypothetical protein
VHVTRNKPKETITVSSSSSSNRRAAPALRPPRRRQDAAGLLNVIHGVLVGVGGVYLATRSVTITIIAALATVVLASLILSHPR